MNNKPILNKDLKELHKAGYFLGVCLLVTVFVNVWQYQQNNKAVDTEPVQALYLIDQAETYTQNPTDFEQKVREVAAKLYIPAEWLMSVMHSESRFDASVANHKGSGATGLIQFMPSTAKDFNTTVEKLRNMNHVEQLDYVYAYLDAKRQQYGDYQSLTELYLAILYPAALADKEDYCFSLYSKGSTAYKQNVGLDINKDGNVTVLDIDRRMKALYPTAYVAANEFNGLQKIQAAWTIKN